MDRDAAVRTAAVHVPAGDAMLAGDLALPDGAVGLVVFAHGSGSSRQSPRNRFVARELWQGGLGTLLFDLLTPQEEQRDARDAALRFDIELLSGRLIDSIDWLAQLPAARGLHVGLFGASTGAAAALVAAAERDESVGAVVSRGGRPDLAAGALGRVRAPTRLIVGGEDSGVIGLNRGALAALGSDEKDLVIVPNATHLFEEPGALEEVARLTREWFVRWLATGAGAGAPAY